MYAPHFVSHFTPSLMSAEALEAVFVQRERVLERLIDQTRESVLTGSRHHTLLVGPRGIGKTHLVSMLYHRLKRREELTGKVCVAWLQEEEWGIASYLDLLIRILRAMLREGSDPALEARLESLYSMSTRAAPQVAERLLLECLGERMLVVLMENLDTIFEGLKEEGQKRLRAFIQEHPVISLVATAQGLFDAVALQRSPFYGFFRPQHLEALTLDEAILLLEKLAAFRGERELEQFLRTPVGRARVRAVRHLAGGNHRVYVILGQFLTRESLDELVTPFMRTLDDLTPYYQSRMLLLSPQQRKLVELFCEIRHAIQVKEIAQRSFLTPQTAAGQLKKLRELGYVRVTEVGRGAWYELREPLMRLCIEVKMNRGEPIPLFVDFLRLWYAPDELQSRLELTPLELGKGLEERRYLELALKRVREDPDDPVIAACQRDLEEAEQAEDYAQALQVAEELVAHRGTGHDWLHQALLQMRRQQFAEALSSQAEAEGRLEEAAAKGTAVFLKGACLTRLERWDEALVAAEQALSLPLPSRLPVQVLRIQCLAELGERDRARAGLEEILAIASIEASVLEQVWKIAIDFLIFDIALNAAERLVALSPDNASYLESLGNSLAFSGQLDEAEKIAARLQLMENGAREALSLRFFLLERQDRNEDALMMSDQLERLDPDDFVKDGYHVLNRGQVLWQLGRYQEALTCLQRAAMRGFPTPVRKFEPLIVSANQLMMADCLAATGRWDEALNALTLALGGNVESTVVYLPVLSHLLSVLLTHAPLSELDTRIEALLALLQRHDQLPSLGEALVRSIDSLRAPEVAPVTRAAWLAAWQRMGSGLTPLLASVRLLAAATGYLEQLSLEPLLNLPLEERRILEPLLGLPTSE